MLVMAHASVIPNENILYTQNMLHNVSDSLCKSLMLTVTSSVITTHHQNHNEPSYAQKTHLLPRTGLL